MALSKNFDREFGIYAVVIEYTFISYYLFCKIISWLLSKNVIIFQQFAIMATDDRNPVQTGSLSARITVRRDQPPQFVSPTPNSIVVDEEDKSGKLLTPQATAVDGDMIVSF